MPVLLAPTNRAAGEQIFLRQAGSHSPAGLPVDNPTRSFWTSSASDANPLATEGSEGLLTQDADICIIGSGITGESTGILRTGHRCIEPYYLLQVLVLPIISHKPSGAMHQGQVNL